MLMVGPYFHYFDLLKRPGLQEFQCCYEYPHFIGANRNPFKEAKEMNALS
jgi:hypothetical protein